MSEDGTIPLKSTGHPVHTIGLTVVGGPDAGARIAAGSDELSVGTAEGNDLVLTDRAVSRYHLELARRGDRVRVTDHGSTNGTRIGPALLFGSFADVGAGTTLEIGQSMLRVDDGGVVMLDRGLKAFGELRGWSSAMRRVLTSAQQIAATDAPVLILGESGTGKELLARAIHDASPRAEQPFVTVDCGALAPTLFASELFGHERGAFTGAERRYVGAFERAQGGTVLLDEIGELSPELQAALLGVLERRRVRRVGGSEEIPLDVRILSATHRDVLAGVNAGTFRLDLFYRIAIVRLTLPPLRERPEDIAPLVEHFLATEGTGGGALFDERALSELGRHAWPGNVRELKNVVLGALALGRPPDLVARGLEPARSGDVSELFGQALALPYRDARRSVLDAFERRYLEALLERAGGSVRQAARDAQMDRKYLTELLRRHGVR
jgi:DNA-binding NtrC family response regulator